MLDPIWMCEPVVKNCNFKAAHRNGKLSSASLHTHTHPHIGRHQYCHTHTRSNSAALNKQIAKCIAPQGMLHVCPITARCQPVISWQSFGQCWPQNGWRYRNHFAKLRAPNCSSSWFGESLYSSKVFIFSCNSVNWLAPFTTFFPFFRKVFLLVSVKFFITQFGFRCIYCWQHKVAALMFTQNFRTDSINSAFRLLSKTPLVSNVAAKC